jgi:hypothetical protein
VFFRVGREHNSFAFGLKRAGQRVPAYNRKCIAGHCDLIGIAYTAYLSFKNDKRIDDKYFG